MLPVCWSINRLNSRRIYHSFCRLSDSGNVKDQQEISITRDDAYCLLQSCESKNDVHYVRRVQGLMVCNGLESLAVLSDHLVRLYAYHGSLPQANEAFEKILSPSSYTWVAIISAHAKLGQDYNLANGLYHCMQLSDANNDKYIFLAVLKGCMTIQSLPHIRIVHNQIMRGKSADLVVGNALVDGYAKCGSLEEAERAFDRLQAEGMRTDQVSWTTIIAGFAQHGEGYADNGEGYLALDCLEKMQRHNREPDEVTFLTILNCINGLPQGRLIHENVMHSGVDLDAMRSKLIETYATCGSLEEACLVFESMPYKTVVAWGTIIAGHVENGESFAALECFEIMQAEDVRPNDVIFSSIVKACSTMATVELGRLIHDEIIGCGLQVNIVVGTALVDMYAKCGNLKEACKVFKSLQDKNVVSWGAIIAGYAQHRESLLALEYFERMQQEGIQPNEAVFTSVLIACAHAGLVDEGHWYFSSMRDFHGIIPNISHYTFLTDLFCQAGCLCQVEHLLQGINELDVVSWKSLVRASRKHGLQLLR